jgi:hypothetical protein
MRILFLAILFFIITSLSAQQKFEFGVIGGTSYYMGDLNHDILFANPGMSIGGKINYSITRRYQLDFDLTYGEFSGAGYKYLYEGAYEIVPHSFSAQMLDIGLLIEFDFLPFDNTTKKKDNYTFFVLGGLGYSFPMGGTYTGNPHFNLPFGIGFKVCPVKRLSAGVEWKYKKTWNDNVDGVESRENTVYKATIQNNDWYSYAGIFVVYRLFYREGDCPAYWN